MAEKKGCMSAWTVLETPCTRKWPCQHLSCFLSSTMPCTAVTHLFTLLYEAACGGWSWALRLLC